LRIAEVVGTVKRKTKAHDPDQPNPPWVKEKKPKRKSTMRSSRKGELGKKAPESIDGLRKCKKSHGEFSSRDVRRTNRF